MTARYQVFVDGARDRSPESVARLAAAMGARYGLAPADLEKRLARGRFKVKAGVDRDTAEEYARDLERLGAICTIIDAAGQTVDLTGGAARGGSALPPPARPASAARPAGAVLPPRTTDSPRPAGAALPGRAAPVRPGSVPTGLAAAAAAGKADLGALDRDDGAIALSSLDGAVDAVIEPTSHGANLPASFGPAADPAPPAPAAGKARNFTGPPVDLFAAPDAEAEEEMELALDVSAEREKKAASQPPPAEPRAATSPAHARGATSPAYARGATAPPVAEAAGRPVATPGPSPGARARALLANARVRFAAGVVVAIVIAFIPVHVIAHIRERAAFAEVDSNLHDRYAAAESPDQYADLDKTRARALERKYDERRDIAMTSLAIWAALGLGLAYVWFRRVPWDRLVGDDGRAAG